MKKNLEHAQKQPSEGKRCHEHGFIIADINDLPVESQIRMIGIDLIDQMSDIERVPGVKKRGKQSQKKQTSSAAPKIFGFEKAAVNVLRLRNTNKQPKGHGAHNERCDDDSSAYEPEIAGLPVAQVALGAKIKPGLPGHKSVAAPMAKSHVPPPPACDCEPRQCSGAHQLRCVTPDAFLKQFFQQILAVLV